MDFSSKLKTRHFCGNNWAKKLVPTPCAKFDLHRQTNKLCAGLLVMFGGVASTSLLQLKMSPFSVITVTPLSLCKKIIHSSQKLDNLAAIF